MKKVEVNDHVEITYGEPKIHYGKLDEKDLEKYYPLLYKVFGHRLDISIISGHGYVRAHLMQPFILEQFMKELLEQRFEREFSILIKRKSKQKPPTRS